MWHMEAPVGVERAVKEYPMACPLGRWANNDRGSLMSSGYLHRYGVQNRRGGDCSYLNFLMRDGGLLEHDMYPLSWWGEEPPEFY